MNATDNKFIEETLRQIRRDERRERRYNENSRHDLASVAERDLTSGGRCRLSGDSAAREIRRFSSY